jgi:hypothetical protein
MHVPLAKDTLDDIEFVRFVDLKWSNLREVAG